MSVRIFVTSADSLGSTQKAITLPSGSSFSRRCRVYKEDKKVLGWKVISFGNIPEACVPDEHVASNRLAERTDSFASRIDIRLRFDAVCKLIAESDP